MSEFIKFIHGFFIKRKIKVNVVIGPSSICFISSESSKPADVNIKEVLINMYAQ